MLGQKGVKENNIGKKTKRSTSDDIINYVISSEKHLAGVTE